MTGRLQRGVQQRDAIAVVENNLAALRILEQDAQVQDEALQAAPMHSQQSSAGDMERWSSKF